MVDLPPVLRDARARLTATFGRRLRDVVLYGSRARGDHRPDSDFDVLVVLTGPIALERDVPATVDALYPIQLELDVPLHASPVDAADYEACQQDFFRRVRREGIAL
ncbi:MAG: nucleotidyltransferase domain-containing protein [Planctomycetes bacterium]|nr:nucleotidyltransferase domain-containing protein [Planctomycetota bacterium]